MLFLEIFGCLLAYLLVGVFALGIGVATKNFSGKDGGEILIVLFWPIVTVCLTIYGLGLGAYTLGYWLFTPAVKKPTAQEVAQAKTLPDPATIPEEWKGGSH